MRKDYWLIPGFEDIYLEDSWVLEVVADSSAVRFVLDLVLRESHALYEPPRPNEQYCYWQAELRFEAASSLLWEGRGARPAIDANGSLDFGNIDSLQFESDQYFLEGDWGTMRLTSAIAPRVEMLHRTPPT